VSIFWLVISALVGFLLGRFYAWGKYHNPEFHEKIALEIAKLRLKRKQVEYQEAQVHLKTNAVYDQIKGSR
jgi:hypothetical protein